MIAAIAPLLIALASFALRLFNIASIKTMIFDEVDAGVGGTVAHTVGQLMQQLGRDRQVLAVTHLPQVAACADQHWVVAKQLRDGATVSRVSEVHGEARTGEIARMLGGDGQSATTSAHASEMLKRGVA